MNKANLKDVKIINLKELFSLSPIHKKVYGEYKKSPASVACGCSICFLNWCKGEKKLNLPKEWQDCILYGS